MKVICYGASEEVIAKVREAMPEVELVRGEDWVDWGTVVIDGSKLPSPTPPQPAFDQPELPLWAGLDLGLVSDNRLERIATLRKYEYVQGPDSAAPGDFAPPVDKPQHKGFYWARWHTPCPGTADNGECCDPEEWMVCHVVENCLDASDPEFLMVQVPGVEKWQPLSGFEWGKEVVR